MRPKRIAWLVIVALVWATAGHAAEKRAGPGQVLVPAVAAQWPGKIFVSHDEWLLTDTGLAITPDGGRLALNVAAWFTGGRSGRFLAYSSNLGLTGPGLAATMTGAGHSWTVTTNVDFSLPNLLQYDAVFLAGDWVDNAVLIDYVRAGGHVFLEGGTGLGGGAVAEASAWNTFLNAFGLGFEPVYDYSIAGVVPVTSSSPLFTGVHALYNAHGNPVTKLDPSDRSAEIVLSYAGYGLYATYETPAIPVALDIKPRVCPNRFNVKKEGKFFAAIAGTADFDVRMIDVPSVRILGVPSHRSTLRDSTAPQTAAPWIGKTDVMACTVAGGDGFLDLILRFDKQEVIQAIEAALGRSLNDGDVVAVTLTGHLKPEFGGTPIVGEDLILVLKERSKASKTTGRR